MSPTIGLAVARELPVNSQQSYSLKDDSGLRSEAVLVREALLARGLETPIISNDLTADEKQLKIKDRFTEILETLGLDLSDDSLCDTPRRIAKMYVNEIFSGLDYSNFPKLTVIENKMNVDEMVRVKNIDLSSTCEHHFITIDGSATVAYIPNEKVIGLSKINRMVRFFAQRPQVQERLNEQVLVALQTLLETDDVAVSITATHFCVKARGVMDANSSTTTTSLGGRFKNNTDTRKEFLLGLQG
ncbi:MAG: GTP cyclohydrolase I FolE [Gammaproteobacteria bacterium]|nr:GTP cyclohydrolase I FolE [Gammaproteobacteria bacterium]MCP4088377.1 GTP cyclohydrolase I FolE [Gammaproteobacteria bacterium]MCP4275084.1 GTP cyclohydrolase I FolE [Gammaproteobacteria bacterium]MCP4830959.1 GTP cyclohydrolase I FolE [Gammaproteobacteria bacterium]MCP4927520.1 GTP cyclohydrolase I FolE [Gammaproteobacteria bacterium]